MRLRDASVLALLVSTACFQPTGTDTLTTAIKDAKEAGRVEDVSPPATPDPARNGRVGLVLATNSVGWRRAAGTADAPGAAVLFVLPGGPAAAAGLARGDVIVEVAGRRVRSDARARALLRARPGDRVSVRVRRGAETLSADLAAARPEVTDLRALYDAALESRGPDPVLLVLRAQTQEDPRAAVDDADRALELAPELVEALALRARRFFDESLQVDNDVVARTDRDRALADFETALSIDPDAFHIVIDRAEGFLRAGDFDRAIQDGFRALALDDSYPPAHAVVAAGRLGRGETGEALRSAHRALTLDPYEARYYRILAQAFLAAGRRADAEKTVEAGLPIAGDEERAALLAVLEDA